MIWQACKGPQQVKPISGTLFRLVESQEQVATMGYVDTLEEQALLETLLEAAKPAYPDAIENYHYLLTSPFRYPPLKYGSRFGQTNEPSLFYAGCSTSVALAESAFYRLVFIDAIEAETNGDKIRTEHSLFTAAYATNKGVQLQAAPFDNYLTTLTHPSDYQATQQLGREMRAAGVAGFEYISARDRHHGICVALYDTSSFVHNAPTQIEQWLCETTMTEVLFKSIEENTLYRFPATDFLIDGQLPMPA